MDTRLSIMDNSTSYSSFHFHGHNQYLSRMRHAIILHVVESEFLQDTSEKPSEQLKESYGFKQFPKTNLSLLSDHCFRFVLEK